MYRLFFCGSDGGLGSSDATRSDAFWIYVSYGCLILDDHELLISKIKWNVFVLSPMFSGVSFFFAL